jgi:hypothetical protein
MKTYTAQIIYKIECDGIKSEQYEEQWRLVFAEHDMAALEEARRIAKDEEATFVDRHGRTVRWKLLAVKDLKELNVEQGALIFSVLKEVEPIAAPLWSE